MAHPLEQKIAQVRSQTRRLLVLYSLGWTVASVTATVLLLGLADYLLRFQDHGIRAMCSLAVLLVAAWAGRRFWFGALGRRLGDVQIAQRIERRFPQLTDRLASTVQFLKQSEVDPQAGSAALRRAVILETTSAVEDVDLSQVFEPRPTRRALVVGGLVGLVALGVALLSPENTRIAALRLAHPFGSDSWPRFYSVQFGEAPTRLAVGKTFEVELVNDAEHRVPDEVRIHFRYESGRSNVEEESEPMHWINGVMVARRENVSRPFWYRAEGGDDASMPWIRLEVVEPPRLEALQLVLHPPDYSGLPVESSEKSIHALRGTRVELSGTSTKKLRGVRIHQPDGKELTVPVSSDFYSFSLAVDAAEPWIIDKSGSYWIDLEDSEGLIGGADDRWEIRAIADQAPTVTIEQPAGNIFVTAQGEVPLKIAAKDDLAIRDIGLHFSRSDRTDVEDFAVPLRQGPDQRPAHDTTGLLLGSHLGENQTLEHRWLLAELGLKPGTQVTFWATASDYLPQTGKSTVRRLSLITPAELEERLAQRQMLIFAELQRVLKLEQEARGQTQSLEIQIDKVGWLNKQDVDHAQSAELNQRQVKRTLTSQTEGIPAQIADFLADLASNRVDSPDIERHMTAILEELDRLGQRQLNTIERELTSLIKAAQSKAPPSAPNEQATPVADPLVNRALRAAGQNQDQVITSLENMLNELGQWDSYRRFAREIAQLQRDQEEIARTTKEIGQRTLGRDSKELDAQQQADLKKLSNQQIELSRRLEKVQQQMAQMGQSLKLTDPISAATISDGLHQAQQQAISGQMRQSSQQIEKNQLGQAAQQQAKIAKDLEDLMAILSNRREQELTRLVKQLRESEQELARIRTQQAGLRKAMKALAEKSNPFHNEKQQLERLAREQRKLEEQAGRLARRLERLQAEQAGRSTSGAAGKMGQAGGAGEQGQAAAAGEQAAKAEKDLEEAQQQLAERRRQAEEDLAHEQMARLEDSLKSLLERQQKVIQDTQRLENLRATEGRFTRAQLGTLNDVARQQKSLRGETALLAEKLSLTEVINMALDGAAKQMMRAAELLEHRETGSQTQGAQEAARRRFAQLLTALENNAKPKPAGQDGGGSGGGGKGARADGDQVLAQLKLLKILQEDLSSRYRTLTPGSDDAGRTAQELTDIATEQGKLADLALKLSQPPESNPEDDPEKLPDVRHGGPDRETEQPPNEPLEPAGKEPS